MLSGCHSVAIEVIGVAVRVTSQLHWGGCEERPHCVPSACHWAVFDKNPFPASAGELLTVADVSIREREDDCDEER